MEKPVVRSPQGSAALCAVATASLMLLVACDKSLPAGPSDVMRGVVIYEHANYEGESAQVTDDIRDLKDYKGPCVNSYDSTPYGSTVQRDWNDCISSIRLAPGWRATLYRDDDFDGDQLDLTADVPNLQLTPGDCSHDGFNDCSTSIRVFGP